MKAEIKNKAIEKIVNTETYWFNFLTTGKSYVSDDTISRIICFDFNYWDEDIMVADIEEITAAVDSRLAEMDLKEMVEALHKAA